MKKLTLLTLLLAQLFNGNIFGSDQGIIEEYFNGMHIKNVYLSKYFGETNSENLVFYTGETKNDSIAKAINLGSLSNMFTYIILHEMVNDSLVNLKESITKYLPELRFLYNNKEQEITVSNVIKHNSAISWSQKYSITDNVEINLGKRNTINNVLLTGQPGKVYEYAALNYDIQYLIIRKILGDNFETYTNNIFNELQLSVFFNDEENDFLKKGAAGIFHRVFSSKQQNYSLNYFYAVPLSLSKIFERVVAPKTETDTLVRDKIFAYYKMVSDSENESYFNLCAEDDYCFCILNDQHPINSTVIHLDTLANTSIVLSVYKDSQKLIENKSQVINSVLKNDWSNNTSNNNRIIILTIKILTLIFSSAILLYLCYVLFGIFSRKRKFSIPAVKRILYTVLIPIALIVLLKVAGGFLKVDIIDKYTELITWSNNNLASLLVLVLAAVTLLYAGHILNLFYTEPNVYLRKAPRIITLTMLSGYSNMMAIMMITSSVNLTSNFTIVFAGFVTLVFFYVLSNKVAKTSIIRLSRGVVYDLRIKLLDRVFSTNYQNFEKINSGKVYSTFNDDIGTVGSSIEMFVELFKNFIIILTAVIYMGLLQFKAMIFLMISGTLLVALYYIISSRTRGLFEDARETRTRFMFLLNGLIDGFKYLSISGKRKQQYKGDIEEVTREYRDKISLANIKFLNALVVGEAFTLAVLGFVVFILPLIYFDLSKIAIMSLVVIILYMLGPINAILNSFPTLIQLRIAWNRVRDFMNCIPVLYDNTEALPETVNTVESFEISNMEYHYPKTEADTDQFSLGPVNFELRKGEILFIIGGNGSGKTTLAKLLTGLYESNKGNIIVNGQTCKGEKLGEYFSTVFHPLYLFKKLYAIDLTDKNEEINTLLKRVRLDKKVSIDNNEFSTIELSGGQRKRLALMQCYLENKPIYLFDEWAADQDPDFRRYFYRELLPQMRNQGKIIIAITHDDHYFDIADKIIKLDTGKVEFLKSIQLGVEV